MKILSRDFTTKEKLLILVLILFLIGLAYYQFVDQPVRKAIETAQNEKAALQVELDAINVKIAQLEKMQREIDDLSQGGTIRMMPSYNNSKAVNTLLNNVLGDLGYSITFSKVTRDGDQIRRNISLQFTALDYDTVNRVLTELTTSEYRCLIDDVQCSAISRRTIEEAEESAFNVGATLTFYETMVGGTADAGLPESKSAAQ